MITLDTNSRAKLRTALTRTAELTLIPTDTDGVYFVDSTNNRYMVVVWKETGEIKAGCQCEAHRHNLICKHIAFSLYHYKVQLENRQAMESQMLAEMWRDEQFAKAIA
jgi:hypothetical protein